MGSMADIMGQVEVSPTQLERVGFKSAHIDTLAIPMRVMNKFSSSSDAPYQATLGQAPGLIRDSGSHAHSASCVVLPAHPTAGQLEYLQARGLIRFVNVSSKGKKSLLNALKGSALKNSAGNLKPNIASVLEIDRDQSQVVEEEVFGSSLPVYSSALMQSVVMTQHQNPRIRRKPGGRGSSTDQTTKKMLVEFFL